MNELIRVTVGENGEKLVSARELHKFLQVGNDFTTWIKSRISKYEFLEGEDFTLLKIQEGKNIKHDYVININMAKELSMVEKNSKGKEARKYFISCEKMIKEVKQLSPLDQLKLQYQVLEVHEEKLNKVSEKIVYLEGSMTIDHGQAVNIKSAVDASVRRLCCGNESKAYLNKQLRSKVYRFVWKSIKEYFNVTAYHNLLRKDTQEALSYISNLTLQGGILREVQQENNQMCLGV